MQRTSSNSLTRNDPKLSKTLAIQSKEIFLGCKALIDYVSVETTKENYTPSEVEVQKMIEVAKNTISNCKKIMLLMEASTNQNQQEPNEEKKSLRTSLSLNRQLSKVNIAVRNSMNKVNFHSLNLQTNVTEIIRSSTEAIKKKIVSNQELINKLKERLSSAAGNIREILVYFPIFIEKILFYNFLNEIFIKSWRVKIGK